MKKVAIYTNGVSFFTLANYDKASGVSEINGVSLQKEVSPRIARAMHTSGSLHYIIGMGDRKVLKSISLKRGKKLGNFDIL